MQLKNHYYFLFVFVSYGPPGAPAPTLGTTDLLYTAELKSTTESVLQIEQTSLHMV